MGDLTVTVIVGTQRWQLCVSPQATFGHLRSLVEQKEAAVEHGLRLIYKGKSFPDHTALCDVPVADGAKMMALRTAKQRSEDAAQAKRARLRTPLTSLAEQTEQARQRASASCSAKRAPSSVQHILGDHPVEGVPSVLLIHGKQKYRFNVQLSHTVLHLKERASALQPIQSRASNMRLLFKGKFLTDEQTLHEVGAKCGSSFMLLFNAKHHDAVEDKQQISCIHDHLQQLEANANALRSQVEHRLLDSVDIAVKKSELQDVVYRLKDNLSSVRSEDERRASMEQRLQSVEHIISRL